MPSGVSNEHPLCGPYLLRTEGGGLFESQTPPPPPDPPKFSNPSFSKLRFLGESVGAEGAENHLEEKLLDQVRASYTPLFWGHLRNIPQGMIFDVQLLVKSLFCPIT